MRGGGREREREREGREGKITVGGWERYPLSPLWVLEVGSGLNVEVGTQGRDEKKNHDNNMTIMIIIIEEMTYRHVYGKQQFLRGGCTRRSESCKARGWVADVSDRDGNGRSGRTGGDQEER